MELDTIVCGDCLDVMAGMKTGSVDLVIADPPFAAAIPSVHDNGTRNWAWRRSYGAFNPLQKWWDLVAEQLGRVMSDKGQIYCFCDAKSYSIVYPTLYEQRTGVVQAIIWEKGHIGLGRHYRYQTEFVLYARNKQSHPLKNEVGNLIKFDRVRDRTHSTQKPLGLVEFFVSNSTEDGDLVFDPFMGSGTTAVAALKLGRHFYGCDINPGYVKLANERIEKARLEMSQTEMF